MSLNYTNAQTGTGHSVSVLICAPNGKPLYYGRPGDCTTNGSGTISFTVPGNLPNGNYNLLVFNEQVNSGGQSDFASTPVAIDLTIEDPDPVDIQGIELYKSVSFANKNWWVIGLNGTGINSKNGTITLLSQDNLITAQSFNRNHAYDTSNLRNSMESFYHALSPDEQTLILPRELDSVRVGTLNVREPDSTLSGDNYVWPLSRTEANTLPQEIRTSSPPWWLRSTNWPTGLLYVDAVNTNGVIENTHINTSLGGRPALTLEFPTIIATANTGGRISPSGTKFICIGDSQTYTITEDDGYELDDVFVDGISVKEQLSSNTYTFTNIIKSHTIEARFKKLPVPHTHTYGTDWVYDTLRHWKECTAGDKSRAEEADHDYGTWTIDKEAAGEEGGTCHRQCIVCGYEQTETNLFRTLTDPETGITVSGYFSSDAALSVKEAVLHEDGTCPSCDEIKSGRADGKLVLLYDIGLSSGIHNGQVDVSIPVGEKYNGQPLILLHCLDKTEERLVTEVKDGCVSGTFTSLSPFAVLETQKVESIRLTPASLTLELGKNRQLDAAVTPSDAHNKNVTWKTSNKNVATVSASGQVKAVKAGTATITCTAADGGGAKVTCKVTVRNTATPLIILKGSAGKNSIRLNWNQISNADGYEIYSSRCGGTYNYKKIKTITKGTTTTWTQSKLKAATAYKYYIKAYKLANGRKLYLRTSKTSHVVTTGGRYTNVKSVTTTFTDITLAKGKTRQISARVTPVKKGGKLAEHVPEFRYKTTNSKVATVTTSGKIKAVGKGKCSIYVYANNGVTKRIQITVK